jgi:hypothetical protein
VPAIEPTDTHTSSRAPAIKPCVLCVQLATPLPAVTHSASYSGPLARSPSHRLSAQLQPWTSSAAPDGPQVKELLLHGRSRPALVRLTDGTAVELAERVPLAEALRRLCEQRQLQHDYDWRGGDGGALSHNQPAEGGGGEAGDALVVVEDAGSGSCGCGGSGSGGAPSPAPPQRPWFMLPRRSTQGAAAVAARAVCCGGAGGEAERRAAAAWPFDADNRTALPGSLHRISAAVGRTGELAGLTYRVGRHVPGAAAPLGDVLKLMAAVHRGAAPGACFRGGAAAGGAWPDGGGGGGGSSPSLLLLGRPGTGKVGSGARVG